MKDFIFSNGVLTDCLYNFKLAKTIIFDDKAKSITIDYGNEKNVTITENDEATYKSNKDYLIANHSI